MFTITCESTVDLSIEYLHKRNCDAICYSYFLGTEERVDHMQNTPETLEQFYKDLEEAQEHMNAGFQEVYLPQEKNFEKYDRLYRQYMKVGRHFEEIQEERNQSTSSANK